MALYRFLFAPVLLATAVVSAPGPSDREALPPPPGPRAIAAPPAAAQPALPAALERAAEPRPVRAR